MSRRQPKKDRQTKQRNVAIKAENSTKEDSVVTTVSLEKIILTDSQPRRYFAPQSMQSLVESVSSEGILQPILVRPCEDEKFELVAGERRYLAAQTAGLTQVPVIVRSMSDLEAMQYALVENLQREDLNPVEETDAIIQLLGYQLGGYDEAEAISLLYRMDNEAKEKITRHLSGNSEAEIVEQVFAALGRMNWQSFVRTRLPLLKLPPDILEALCSRKISIAKAKEIARLKSEPERQAFLEEAIALDLTLNQIQERIKGDKLSTEGKKLQLRMEETYKLVKKSKVWNNPAKRKILEALLVEIEVLLFEE